MTDAPLDVTTDAGPVRGRATKTARVFLGIRYAEPPVGSRRWTLPQPPRAWDCVADATRPPALCPQPGMPTTMVDEDCLFVNVTTPRRASRDPLPVMVWLHGGGFTTGGGHLYDAARLANQGNVAVVTVNYRLGVFGYFGFEGLPGSGNFGLADQIAALDWVKRNAAAFGADPDNVTVFGQSAGAMSIGALLASPAAPRLFQRAILQSGSPLLHWPRGIMFPRSPEHTPYLPLPAVEQNGAALAELLECGDGDVVARLREVPASRLVEHTGLFANSLAFGTPLVPLDPAEATRTGKVHAVPIISGATRDEMRPFIAGAAQKTPLTESRLAELRENSFAQQASVVAERYPVADHGSPALTWATIATDVSWAFAAFDEHRLWSRSAPVFAYEFADRSAPDVNGIAAPRLRMGAAHATELPYLFDLGGENRLSPAQRELADTMIASWTSFARTGTPTLDGTPSWRDFGDDESVLQFDETGIRSIDYRERHKLDFWRSVRERLAVG